MHLIVFVALALLGSAVAPVNPADANTAGVSYQLEVDGQQIGDPLGVSFLLNGKEYQASSDGNRFDVPLQVQSASEVTIHFRFGNYDFVFPRISSSQLNGTWIIRVDTKPFERGNLSLLKVKSAKIDYIYSIVFYSPEGSGTGVVSYKKRVKGRRKATAY